MRSKPVFMVVASPTPEVEISRWCHSAGKRTFDLACGVSALLIGLPLMLIIAVVVRLTSKGPVFFRQSRVGRDGREFMLLKFRTMTHGTSGPGVTRLGDSRITAVGCALRKSKLDELPQLFNVISGDMSLVGPRPDLAEFLVELLPEHRKVLTLRPGITGWATLHFRFEEELLAAVPQERLRDYYINTLLQQKVRLDLEYAGRASFLKDLLILIRSVLAIVQ